MSTTINLFGTVASDEKEFYRGLSDRFKFNDFSLHLFGPISTTSAKKVAANFANETGIILKLQKQSCSHNTVYFKCKYYSSHPAEQELLFFGHENYFNVTKFWCHISAPGMDTTAVLIFETLITQQKNDVDRLLHSPQKQNIIRQLNQLLINDNDPNDYRSETVYHLLRSKQRICIRMSVLMQILKWVKASRDAEIIQDFKSLCDYVFVDGEMVYTQKIIQSNMNKIVAFQGCEFVTFDFDGWNNNLTTDNCTWNNLVVFMNESRKRNYNIKKIEIRNLTKNQCSDTSFLPGIIQQIDGSGWYLFQRSEKNRSLNLKFRYGSVDSFDGDRGWKRYAQKFSQKVKAKLKSLQSTVKR